MWQQELITLDARPRGFHLITDEVRSKIAFIREFRLGIVQLHLLHTSAGLTLNENASPDVRVDMASWTDDVIPEQTGYWTHTFEGPDDMPAHVKSSLFGPTLSLPIHDGNLLLGRWQGIYLGEFRDRGGHRQLVATAWGDV